ncbi:Hypothetical_protein [Hexamita inflata]|uniref:Hypothetical_protein n=1 Tax=Hexamita inflata TaxID=28002 RepID=A0AA86TGB1_9EUKA|nr:Hypothetical protein HINF_LOCUS108 [Hexamita inflata]
MEIKLNETFNTLVISIKPEQKDANPYKYYFGLQYDCVKVRGNKQLFSLNSIDKYIIKADSLSLNDCLINQDQLQGKFKKITFKDCTLIGQTTSNFRTDQPILMQMTPEVYLTAKIIKICQVICVYYPIKAVADDTYFLSAIAQTVEYKLNTQILL